MPAPAAAAVPAEARPSWPGFVAIVVLTVALYLPSLANGFVWDDDALVLRDPLIRSWRLGSEAFDHFIFLDVTGSDFYRPLQRLTFLADYQLYAFQPWGYHLGSAVIHALAAGSLFLLARALFGKFSPARSRTFWPAFATALIWAVHPLHTSAVTYVSGRADPLAALFCFLGLATAVAALRNPLVNWREFAAGLCFLLAAFSKEIGLISFVLWVLVVLCARAGKSRVAAAVLISACAVGVYAFMRAKADRLPPPASRVATLAERPALAAAALGEYAELVVFPRTLRMERGAQRRPPTDPPATAAVFFPPSLPRVLAGIVVAALLALWLAQSIRRGNRAQMVGLLLATASYLPVSNLLSLNATVAEHWLYLPLAFLLVAAVDGVSGWFERTRHSRPATARLALAGVAAWVALLGARNLMRQPDWKDPATFIERTIAAGGGSVRMYVNRAQEAARHNDHARARADFERAERMSPGLPFPQLGLAAIDLSEENYPGARARLNGIKDPYFRPAALELLALVTRAERSGDGMAELDRALSLRPDDWPLTRRKARLLAADGKNSEATVLLRDFMIGQPFRSENWLMLARGMQAEGNLIATAKATQRAHELDVHLTLPEVRRTREDSNLKPSDP